MLPSACYVLWDKEEQVMVGLNSNFVLLQGISVFPVLQEKLWGHEGQLKNNFLPST